MGPPGTAPLGAQPTLSQLAAAQPGISPHVAQLLAGAFAARTIATTGDRLEPTSYLTDRENSACNAFDGMSMGRPEASSSAEAASNATEVGAASGSQQPGVRESVCATAHAPSAHGASEAIPIVGPTAGRVAVDIERIESGKLDADGCQGRSAARRLKLHTMLKNL